MNLNEAAQKVLIGFFVLCVTTITGVYVSLM